MRLSVIFCHLIAYWIWLILSIFFSTPQKRPVEENACPLPSFIALLQVRLSQCTIPPLHWFSCIKAAFDFTQANETAVGKTVTELSIFVMQSVDGAPCVNVCTGIHPDLASNPFHWKEDLSGAARSLSLFLCPFSLSLSLFHQQHGIEPDERIVFYSSVHFSYRLCFYVSSTPAQGRTAVWALDLLQLTENSFHWKRRVRM